MIGELDSQLLSPLANIAGAVGGVILIYVGLMRFLPPVQMFLIMRPLSWKRARQAGMDRSTWRHLRRTARAHLKGHTIRPGDALGDLLRLHEVADRTTPWTDWRLALEACIARATAPDTSLVTARLIVPEQVERLDDLLAGMARLLARFDRVLPVSSHAAQRPPQGEGEVSASCFASALSGAAVLVDAGGTRSGTVDNVLVWADTTFRDYECTWKERKTFSQAKSALVFDETTRLGDYNGRLIELQAISLAANSLEGQVSFVLETTETSYRTTEPPSDLAAKGLVPASQDPRLPSFHRDDRATYRRRRISSIDQRACPVTSYVSLLTRSAPVEGVRVFGLPPSSAAVVDMIVLCQRSAVTRNGPGTLSATAGGVIELDQGDIRLDTDDLGAPDVTGSALREMVEELGIPRNSVNLAPVATFIATVDGRRNARSDRGSGQLVASVLHLGTTSIGLDGLLDAKHNASASRGAFEVDSLEAIAMLPGNEGLIEFVKTVHQLADRLDQHGLLTCFYAALRFYSAGVIEAFATAFEAPWWAIPWAEDANSRPRVVRDVRSIIPQEASSIENACVRWAEDWSDLSARLDEEKIN